MIPGKVPQCYHPRDPESSVFRASRCWPRLGRGGRQPVMIQSSRGDCRVNYDLNRTMMSTEKKAEQLLLALTKRGKMLF